MLQRKPVLLPHYVVESGSRIVTLAGRDMQLSPAAVALASRCTGDRTLAEIAADLLAADTEANLQRLIALGIITLAPAFARNHSACPAHIVFSPHIDDAALSLGGVIANLTQSGEDVAVMNVFSHQSFQTGLRVPEPLLAAISKQEDLLAGAQLGYQSWFVPLRGAQDRHAAKLRQILGQPMSVVSKGGRYLVDLPKVKFAIRSALLQSGWHGYSARIYAPLGLGGHLDHVLVHRAIIELSAEGLFKDCALYFYEDLPYAAFEKSAVVADEQIAVAAKETGKRLQLQEVNCDISSNVITKTAALKVFRTRIRDADIDVCIAHAQAIVSEDVAVERIYAVLPG